MDPRSLKATLALLRENGVASYQNEVTSKDGKKTSTKIEFQPTLESQPNLAGDEAGEDEEAELPDGLIDPRKKLAEISRKLRAS